MATAASDLSEADLGLEEVEALMEREGGQCHGLERKESPGSLWGRAQHHSSFGISEALEWLKRQS